MNPQQPPFPPQGHHPPVYYSEQRPQFGSNLSRISPSGCSDAADLQRVQLAPSPLMTHAAPPYLSPRNPHNGLPPPVHHPDPNMTRVNPMPSHSNPHMPEFAGVHYARVQHQQHPSSQPGVGGQYTMRGGVDVFGGPMELSPEPNQQVMNGDIPDAPMYSYPVGHNGFDFPPPQMQPAGITPARLGPAPRLSQPYLPGSSDSQVTPLAKHKTQQRPSSADGSSDNSSSGERTARMATEGGTSSDVETDSPTRRVRGRLPTFEHPEPRPALPQKRKAPPARPKLAKVAEDPGVEGVPEGPRPMERPPLSFAWLIGTAILSSSAGGLSLEHIYRWISTSYPYFQTDTQWRNSVRHNLSIHKIFVTIPRSEKHPPGKGGIWTIPEDEMCHWSSTGDGHRFIKTFPETDPHYEHCRQTKWDRQVTLKAQARAKAEGKEWVPKKGKRSKALRPHQSIQAPGHPGFPLPPPPPGHMMAPHPQMMAPHGPPPSHMQHPSMPMPPHPPPPPMASVPISAPPQAPIRGLHHPPAMHMPRPGSPHPLMGAADRLQVDDDGLDFEPEEQETQPFVVKLQPLRFNQPKDKRSLAGPASVSSSQGQENRPPVADEDGVFSNNGPVKPPPAFRRAFEPASPGGEAVIVDINDFLANDDENLYETPAPKRQEESSGATSGSTHNVTSSAFKTPALTHTSSSPTSSPLPPTVPRGPNHHPSGLQHEWNPVEEARSSGPRSSPPGLDAPFAMKPTTLKRTVRDDDDDLHLAPRAAERAIPKTPGVAPKTPGLPGKSMGGPPKTPVTRFSATTTKTPLNYTTPMRSILTPRNEIMSTPMWEITGCLERLEEGNNNMTPRLELTPNKHPTPSTEPSCYSLDSPGRGMPKGMVLEIGSPVQKRRKTSMS